MSFFNKIRLFYRALFDKRTPKIVKILTVIAVIYGISPIDIIPDFIPVVGQLDDIIVILGLLMEAFKYIPAGMKTEATSGEKTQKRRMDDVIDV
ncbi:MAG: hypothetical protein JWM56_1308 [Candidatus Peribacteria bacterium]|nr:hypothetical protein [Candidatus Peribacteria bacterium]